MEETENSNERALIEEFISGKLPDDLQLQVGNWITRQKEEDKGTVILGKLFDTYAGKYSGSDYRTTRIWKKHCRRFGFVDPKGRRLMLHKQMARVAAVAVPVMLMATGFLLSGRIKDAPDSEQISYVAVGAGNEVRKNVLLPCGTEIVLKPGSEIKYNETGYPDDRSVTLYGEAFFSVAAVDGKPFTVHAAEMSVTVLGTQFNIKALEADVKAEVSLLSGSVEVATRTERVVLEPLEKYSYDKSTGESEKTVFNPVAADNWRSGTSELNGVPLPEALEQVAAFYGMELVVQRWPGKTADVNLVLRDAMPVEEILDMILFMTGSFTFEITEDTIYIK